MIKPDKYRLIAAPWRILFLVTSFAAVAVFVMFVRKTEQKWDVAVRTLKTPYEETLIVGRYDLFH